MCWLKGGFSEKMINILIMGILLGILTSAYTLKINPLKKTAY